MLTCNSASYYSPIWHVCPSAAPSFSFTGCDWWNEPWSRDRQRRADVFIEANKKQRTGDRKQREREREREKLSGILEWHSNFHLQKQGLWIPAAPPHWKDSFTVMVSDMLLLLFTCCTLSHVHTPEHAHIEEHSSEKTHFCKSGREIKAFFCHPGHSVSCTSPQNCEKGRVAGVRAHKGLCLCLPSVLTCS